MEQNTYLCKGRRAGRLETLAAAQLVMVIAWAAICQMLCHFAAHYIAQAEQMCVAVLVFCLCWVNSGRYWRRGQ